jgi:hypothetical protein
LPGIDSNPISIYKEHIIPDVSIVPSFLQYQYVTKYVINEEFSATIIVGNIFPVNRKRKIIFNKNVNSK